MATYKSYLGAGDTNTNAFDSSLLAVLDRRAPQGALLSFDGLSMDYNLSLFDSFSLIALQGFTAPWSGTINAIASFSGAEVFALGEGFAISGAAMRDALAEGDADALNTLAWSGDDQITGGKSNDTLRGFNGRDVLRGASGDDTLLGDAGNDTLRGGSGDDNLFGGTGNDQLLGGTGSDLIVGGAGRDVIRGGAGTDTMRGGAGADIFKFTALDDFTGSDIDRITDFSQTQGDWINLRLIDADSTADGNQTFTFFDNTGDTLTETPTAGSLVIEPGGDADVYAVLLFTDNSGDYLAFLVHSQDGVITADDFML